MRVLMYTVYVDIYAWMLYILYTVCVVCVCACVGCSADSAEGAPEKGSGGRAGEVWPAQESRGTGDCGKVWGWRLW